ncbi:Oidioi.mRNA.OKI2018_I69.XSR.g14856.t1.cds [Oikopleura dioica]|uniref:Oidioi.mRNA.OKI2018_I69.XSR.g14856.t1.cds n=1 Tax=Oikopleura dioica TaxID=34765 RepID=A0ABN7SF23_OIKDI|nr:Oidioi.mRNA.OKI2018_I69.XSR.g14856.t1.cds [Oikopleura dioica]
MSTWKNNQLPECMEDEDQCAANPCDQAHTIRCQDLIRDFRCECEYGYGKKDCGTLVNYCVNNPCVNGIGGEKGDGCIPEYEDYTCNCQLNWEGKNCEKEVKDCRREVLEPSDEAYQCVHGECDDQQEMCICAPGWVHSNSGFDVCDQDEDECETGSHQCEHQCENTIGSYICKCNKGYIKSSQNSNKCDDVDECRHNNGGCEKYCSNTEGSFQCSCPDGFTLDMRYERHCYDDDECEDNNGGCSQECKNTHGSYYCGCEDGYYLDNDRHTCKDLDECHPEDLPAAALSQDLNPSLKMQLDNMEPNGKCDQLCVNEDGGYHCTCESGYHILNDGFTCMDDDECLDGTHECTQKCINTDGSYDCSCKEGFKLDTSDWKTCHDIDECLEKQHDCRSPSVCENTIGSYECPCPSGYTPAMSRYSNPPCIDIDECQDTPCAHGGICTNIDGDFLCSCINTGFIGKTCEIDLDECRCMEDPDYKNEHSSCLALLREGQRCQHECQNFNPDLDKQDSDKHTCNNINECECFEGGSRFYNQNREVCEEFMDRKCTEDCRDTSGDFQCKCKKGHWLQEDGFTCADVDECRCMNDQTYKDIDECSTGSHTCDEGFVCQNTVPKYECVRPNVPTVCHEPIEPMAESYQTGRKFNGENSQVIDLKIVGEDKHFEFAVNFRTRDESGVLMEMSSRKSKKNKGQLIRVKLADGMVTTVLSEGSEIKGSQNVTNSYSNGYFSTLTFRRDFGATKALKISIDGNIIFSQDGFDQGTFGTNMRRLELGGSKDQPLIDPSNSLDACFQKQSTTFFNKYEIPSEVEVSSSEQCFAEIVDGDGIYAEGNGYATFDISKLENLHRKDSHFSFGFYAIIESNTGTIFKFGPLELSVKFGKLFLTLTKRGRSKTVDLADWVVRDKKKNPMHARQLHFCDGAKHIIKAKLIQEPNANTNKAIIVIGTQMFKMSELFGDTSPDAFVDEITLGGEKNTNKGIRGMFMPYPSNGRPCHSRRIMKTTCDFTRHVKDYVNFRLFSAPARLLP